MPLRSPFNEAQQFFIDRIWNITQQKKGPQKKPCPRLCRSAWASCQQVGPEISPQAIGRYFANRLAEAENRPRGVLKTPEQLEMLNESFADEPWPYTTETIRLVYKTGLERQQVQSWFENERKKCIKNGLHGNLMSTNEENTPAVSAKLWREFEKDREGFMEKYFPPLSQEEEEEEEEVEE